MPNHDAHDHGQEGLQQRGQVVDRYLDLLVVELTDLAEHPVQGTGLFADLDHLHHEDGDDVLVLAQWIGQRSTFADAVLRFDEYVADRTVSRGVGGRGPAPRESERLS